MAEAQLVLLDQGLFLCTHIKHDAYTVEWSILGFSPVRQKKKKKTENSRQVFPWAALSWAVLDFFVQVIFFFASPHSATHEIVIVIGCSCVCMVFIVNFFLEVVNKEPTYCGGTTIILVVVNKEPTYCGGTTQ